MGKEKFGQSVRIDFVDEHPVAVKLKGVLRYKVYRHIGEKKILIEDADEQNLIVDLARVQMARLTAGETEGRSIAKVAFGTNGTPPAAADTAIANALAKDVDGFEYPQPGQVKFNWGLSVSEGNGMEIREFGLIAANGALFARRTRNKPLNKESDISLEGSWTVIF